MKSDNMLHYKGYSAKPEFSVSDGVFYGKILGISDLVDFYSENAKELEKEFQNAVDDYLAFCEEIGKVAEKEYSGTFNVRISPELHKRAANLAISNGMTLNKFVENALRNAIEPNETLDVIPFINALHNTLLTTNSSEHVIYTNSERNLNYGNGVYIQTQTRRS